MLLEDQSTSNKLKSYLIFLLVPGILVGLVYLAGRIFFPGFTFGILIIGIIISLIYVLISYYNSDELILKVVKAREANEKEHKYIINTVEGLCIAAHIPKPKIYVQESEDINAFATGRNPKDGKICVTTGAIKNLTREELEGVLAHELSHVKNYDILFMSVVIMLIGVISIVSEMMLRGAFFGHAGSGRNRGGGSGNAIFLVIGIILAILAPIVARLVQLAISRKREFLADSSGALLSRNPEGLAKALEKIKNQNSGKMKVNAAVAPLYFENPFSSKHVSALFSTHPDINERIKRLREG